MNKSPAEVLEDQGWLTLNQFVQYLKDEHSIKSLSYPAILRYVEKGVLEATKVGGQRRITRECIEHYLEYGTEVPFGADPADYLPQTKEGEGGNTSSSTSVTPSTSPPERVKILEGHIPESLVIPAIPKPRVKRPNIPPPPDDD